MIHNELLQLRAQLQLASEIFPSVVNHQEVGVVRVDPSRPSYRRLRPCAQRIVAHRVARHLLPREAFSVHDLAIRHDGDTGRLPVKRRERSPDQLHDSCIGATGEHPRVGRARGDRQAFNEGLLDPWVQVVKLGGARDGEDDGGQLEAPNVPHDVEHVL